MPKWKQDLIEILLGIVAFITVLFVVYFIFNIRCEHTDRYYRNRSGI